MRLAVPFLLLALLTTAVTASTAARATTYAGEWEGTYLCSQGTTAFTLHVTETANILQAVLNFRVPDGTADPTIGAFTLVGEKDPARGTVTLRPTGWLQPVSGYVMIGMTGAIGSDGAFQGRMIGARCHGFLLYPKGQRPPDPMTATVSACAAEPAPQRQAAVNAPARPASNAPARYEFKFWEQQLRPLPRKPARPVIPWPEREADRLTASDLRDLLEDRSLTLKVQVNPIVPGARIHWYMARGRFIERKGGPVLPGERNDRFGDFWYHAYDISDHGLCMAGTNSFAGGCMQAYWAPGGGVSLVSTSGSARELFLIQETRKGDVCDLVGRTEAHYTRIANDEKYQAVARQQQEMNRAMRDSIFAPQATEQTICGPGISRLECDIYVRQGDRR